MNILHSYQNGNTRVTLFEDGTKERVYEGTPFITHPESIDVKITNYCDLGCFYCHESSTKEGLHADLHILLDTIKELPKGIELAIGGGNPLSHPDIYWFLEELKVRGFIANLTVNQGHLGSYFPLIEKIITNNLVYGLGISITSGNYDWIKKVKELTPHVVYHLIAGVHLPKLLEQLIGLGNCKALLLGYKQFGFGKKYYGKHIEAGLNVWRKVLPEFLGKCTLSFDNLAIEQLQLQKILTKKAWDKFYMGDDFQFTMYIDAVNQEYAQTSRSSERVPFAECSLLDYFNQKV